MRRFVSVVIAVTLLSGSVVQAASYQLTSGAIVDPILNLSGVPHSYSGNNLEPWADLSYANLFDAALTNANLSWADLGYATFSTGTTLKDGQTVLQYGFDAAGLEAYLEASPVSAWSASNLTIVPEPASLCLLLVGLLLLTRVRV